MNKTELVKTGPNMEDINPAFFLIGLVSEFNNRFQAVGDTFFEDISWKQVFALNCITLFKSPPTIKELAKLLGGSHQNAKQILSKLEKSGFVRVMKDDTDGRKQRIILTEKSIKFQTVYADDSAKFTQWLFQEVDINDLETTIRVITQIDNRLKIYQEENK